MCVMKKQPVQIPRQQIKGSLSDTTEMRSHGKSGQIFKISRQLVKTPIFVLDMTVADDLMLRLVLAVNITPF